MRQSPLNTYCCVALCAVLLLSTPQRWTEGIRASVVSFTGPLWKRLMILQVVGSSSQNSEGTEDIFHHPQSESEEVALLEAEKHQLESQLERMRSALSLGDDQYELERQKAQKISARVIFRSPVAWNSYLWLDVGSKDNRGLGVDVVALNSPVIVGNALVGVVDKVNKSQCRVCLITNPSLTPSVRAVRGSAKRETLLRYIDLLAEGLANDGALFQQPFQRERILDALLDGREILEHEGSALYLAKGELRGAHMPLWRREGTMLRGVGFNYDFADEEGPARDLRTGRLRRDRNAASMALVQTGDLLVTTGFDGILPSGLAVGQVANVHPLREGDYFYELEAQPCVGDFNELSLVTILPPYCDEPCF